MTGIGPDLSIDDFAAVRLIQLYTYAQDAAATPIIERAAKAHALGELLVSTANWSSTVPLPAHLEGLNALTAGNNLAYSARKMLCGLSSSLRSSSVQSALIEVATSTAWPKGVNWAVTRNAQLAIALSFVEETISVADVDGVEGAYVNAAKRLRKDSISPGTQLTFGTFMAGAAAASGGTANAVGALVGAHVFGLSGAAATSAGLALLGGGSLAAGGFGMAGGTILIQSAVHAVSASARKLAIGLASTSSSAFIGEVAKLDVSCMLDPSRQPTVLAGLKDLESDLHRRLNEIRPDSRQRRQRLRHHVLQMVADPADVVRHAKNAYAELPSAEERNLAASLRALEYELRHLASPGWKRLAHRVPRAFGMPAISKVLDAL
jgi:hypothetical protein